MKQNIMNLIFCAFLGAIVVLLLISNSKQPIDVHFTVEEIIEELCNVEAKKEEERGYHAEESLKETQ